MLFYFFLSLPPNFVTTKMMKAVMLNKMVMKVKMITNKKMDKRKNKKNHIFLNPMLIMPQMLSAMEWLLEQDSSKLLLLLASHIKLMELLALVMINSLLQA